MLSKRPWASQELEKTQISGIEDGKTKKWNFLKAGEKPEQTSLIKGDKILQTRVEIFENQIQDEILRLHGLPYDLGKKELVNFLENWIAKA